MKKLLLGLLCLTSTAVFAQNNFDVYIDNQTDLPIHHWKDTNEFDDAGYLDLDEYWEPNSKRHYKLHTNTTFPSGHDLSIKIALPVTSTENKTIFFKINNPGLGAPHTQLQIIGDTHFYYYGFTPDSERHEVFMKIIKDLDRDNYRISMFSFSDYGSSGEQVFEISKI